MAVDGRRGAADRAELPAGSDSGLRTVGVAAAAQAGGRRSAEARALAPAAARFEAALVFGSEGPDKVRDGSSGERHQPDAPARAELHRDPRNGLVIRTIHDTDEVVGAEERVLRRHLGPEFLDLLVHFLQSLVVVLE